MSITIGNKIFSKIQSRFHGGEQAAYQIVILNENINGVDQFIRDIPVYPEWRERIRKMELVRAIHGTLALEGSDVEIRQIEKVVEDKTSKETGDIAGKEVRNVLNAFDFIIEWSNNNVDAPVHESVVRQLHTIITRDCDYNSNKEGEYRNFPVSFGTPRKQSILNNRFEIEEAMKELIKILNSEVKDYPESLPIVKSLYAHYFITLIHPFADGNGRVARALEALILYHFGGFEPYLFPVTANFYYKNRVEYFKLLGEADNTTNLCPFMVFAMRGLLKQLTEIKIQLRDKITESMILDYAIQLVRSRTILQRQFNLLEIMFHLGKCKMATFWDIPAIKGLYHRASDSTRKRDIKHLINMELLKREEVEDGIYISVNWDALSSVTLRLDKIPHRPEK